MLRDNHLKIKVGDQVRVSTKFKEADKERKQTFEGIVIRIKGAGENRTFTVRAIVKGNIGVEKTWPVSSPNLVGVKTVGSRKIRRSKLYYLRSQVGHAARPKATA